MIGQLFKPEIKPSTGTITPKENKHGSNGSERVLHTSLNFRTGASQKKRRN